MKMKTWDKKPQGLEIKILLLLVMFLKPVTSYSSDLDPEKIRGKSQKQPVSVLQNRYFLKAYRPEVGVVGGSILNEAYTNTSFFGGRAGLFFSEWLGVEFQYLKTNVAESADKKALEKKQYKPLDPAPGEEDVIVRPNPEINPISEVSEASLIFAPLYGKLNLLNLIILYSDLYVTTGYSRINTEQGVKNAAAIGGGERFYVFDFLSFRIEFKDRIFDELRAHETSRRHSLGLDFGFSLFLF